MIYGTKAEGMNIADAVGATLCRPVRRGGVINNQPVVCSRKFYFHTENTEFTEVHLLRVLALRNICATMCAEWFCDFCEVCVKYKFVRVKPPCVVGMRRASPEI